MIAGLQIADFTIFSMLLTLSLPTFRIGDADSGLHVVRLVAEAFIFGGVLSLVLTMAGAYRYNRIARPGLSSLIVVGACVAVLGPLMLLNASRILQGGEARNSLLAIICVLTALRPLFAWMDAGFSRSGLLAHTVCLVGAGAEAEACIEQLQAATDNTLLLGYFRADDRWSAHAAGVGCLGHVDQLAAYLRRRRVDEVIVATPVNDREHLSKLVADLDCLPVALSLWPGTVSLPVQGTTIHGGRTGRDSLLPLRRPPLSGWAWVFKEVHDRVLAALLLLAALPALLLISLAIRLCSPGPVFYRQAREGYGGREFSIFKFRTMHVAASEPTDRLVLTSKNDKRIFPLGALLRRTSLDELPQLLNVLNGDMWLIGPRPHSPLAIAGDRLYADAVPRYSARHRIKPGITGWAQVNGWRGPTDTVEQIQQRVTHDLYYIDHWSPLLDMRILLLTALRGFVHKNAF